LSRALRATWRASWTGGTFRGSRRLQPGSEISLRIFTREDEALDEAWLRNRIGRAQTHRDVLRVDADVYRLLHAEADGIPGLVEPTVTATTSSFRWARRPSNVGSLPSSPFSKTSSLPPASFCAVIRLFGGAKAWPGG
jgi:hypothetical protein